MKNHLSLSPVSSRLGRGALLAVAMTAAWLPVSASAQQADTPPVGWDASAYTWTDSVGTEGVQLEGGIDIQWTPEPYEFVAGESVKYIDFETGDDAGDGTQAKPWKHHPWDENATGKAAKASGVHTYVFKRGVTYRGALVADDSGTPDEPIRLTSDPSWGEGEAVLAGSYGIDGGWQRVSSSAAEKTGFPKEANGKLWAVKLDGDFTPRALWVVGDDGQRQRQKIARWPNWEAEHPYNIYTQWLRVKKIDKGFPRTTIYSDDLKGYDKDAFRGATLWIDMPVTSGEFSIMGPFPTSVGGYDPKDGSLKPELNHPVRHPADNTPFYLENLPRFLDEAGEWYFSAKGDDARTLYVWLPDDADPNGVQFEAAQREITLDIVGQQHIEVSGLTFNGGNALELTDAPDVGNYERPQVNMLMSSIRLKGNTQNINLHHVKIHDSAGSGITNLITDNSDVVRNIRITDSEFDRIDNGAIDLVRGFSYRKTEASPKGRLTQIHLLRNRMYDIGTRNSAPQGGKGIHMNGPEVVDIAGNVIEWTGAQGIDLHGGRPGGGWMSDYADTPLIRILVHRNKVKDTLLQKQDFGGIEFWGQGPVYLYNNISIDPIGFGAHTKQYHKNQAYYFDHGYKAALFNNLGWSSSRDDAHLGIIGDKFLQEIRNRYNQAFNNTGYNFRGAFSHESRHGDQQQYLANLMINAIGGFHSHYTLDEAQSLAFSHNLYGGKYENFYRRYKGDTFRTIGLFQDNIAPNKNMLATDVGWVTDDMPVRDPKANDFRLTDDSAAIERGVKVFLPWSLYANVGEWHFRLQPDSPTDVISYDLYPQDLYTSKTSFQLDSPVPDNHLKGEGFTAADYEAGVLEDWAPGAMTFNGKKMLTLPNERLVKDFHNKGEEGPMFPGKDRKTVRMTDNSFLIEAVFRADKPGGTVAEKMGSDAGYAMGIDEQGQLLLQLKSAGGEASWRSVSPVVDGKWHHAIAEVDRQAETVTLYLDGKAVGGSPEGSFPAASVSLDNSEDFVVGQGFSGALDYLRVSRGTLAEALTTIDELMAWQFNGPTTRDFADRPITGNHRDIGALEHPTIGEEQPINYTPPQVVADSGDGGSDEGANAFKTGDDRTVVQKPWGSVSVPKQVRAGEMIDVQVMFATETFLKTEIMRIDLHAFVNGQRKPGHGRASPIKVQPTVTSPYTTQIKLKPKDGMSRVAVVIYASPDGGNKGATISTEVGVDVVSGEPAAQSESSEPVEPGTTDDDDRSVKEFDWATVRYPESAKVGDKVPLTIEIKADTISQDAVLLIDAHWFKGRERKQGAGRSGKQKVKANEAQTINVDMTVPDKEGIAAMQFVIVVSPSGGWADRIKSSEVGTKVTK